MAPSFYPWVRSYPSLYRWVFRQAIGSLGGRQRTCMPMHTFHRRRARAMKRDAAGQWPAVPVLLARARLAAAYLSEAHDGGVRVWGRSGEGYGDLARDAVGADLFAGFKAEAA